MNKEICEEQALQYALGTLPRADVEAFEKQLRKDRELQDLVNEYQVVSEFDARDCPQIEPPFQAYAQLMGKIDEEIAGESKQNSSKAVPFLAWAGWAVAACAIVALSLSFYRNSAAPALSSDGDIMLSALGNPGFKPKALPAQQDEGFEERMISLADLAEAYWFTHEGLPPEQIVASDSNATMSGGFTIYDREYKIGFIGVENMPVERQGKAYHVWAKIAGSSSPVRAGALNVGENSRGLFFFDLSANEDDLDLSSSVSFFVTEESEERPLSPSGRVVLSDI